MPLYVANQSKLPERLKAVPQHRVKLPARVVDLDTGEWMRFVVWVDTDAGELEQFVTDGNGVACLSKGRDQLETKIRHGRFAIESMRKG